MASIILNVSLVIPFDIVWVAFHPLIPPLVWFSLCQQHTPSPLKPLSMFSLSSMTVYVTLCSRCGKRVHVWFPCVRLWDNPGDSVQDAARIDWQPQHLPGRNTTEKESHLSYAFPISPPIVLVNHFIDTATLLIPFQCSTPVIFWLNYCTISALTGNPCLSFKHDLLNICKYFQLSLWCMISLVRFKIMWGEISHFKLM